MAQAGRGRANFREKKRKKGTNHVAKLQPDEGEKQPEGGSRGISRSPRGAVKEMRGAVASDAHGSMDVEAVAEQHPIPSGTDSDELQADTDIQTSDTKAGATTRASIERVMAERVDAFLQTKGKECIRSMLTSTVFGLT